MTKLRTYYDTQIKIYHLLVDHPIMSNLLSEFEIEQDSVKDVAQFLLEYHTIIEATPLNEFYSDSEIIEQIGELYGFLSPFEDQVSVDGTPLLELLNFTLYLYKFGTTNNFYETHLLDFIPEYDRDYILAQPKLKLLYESIGRKMDSIELSISQMKNIYDIDEVPDELLDYLGQNIGYEKEDYTLKNVSFRELLKNIIEIYKIKGTNYSFSFFFKFLGFEISLKEFFFNRDVQNPESFPNVEEHKVEYYLTTNNPLFDISKNKPAPFLSKTKNINDWELELKSLEEKGCKNPIQYMLGFESFNKILDNPIYHSDPWTYFKTNLIEYELNPFFDKLNLTSNDNETIKKYVKFLSPTYLFTWINVNLRPWVEDINIIHDSQDDWMISIVNNLGDPRPTPTPWPYTKKTSTDPGFNGFNNDGVYYDYEPLDEVLKIYQPGGEELIFSLENNMNLGDHEHIGTTLKRDGVYVRQPGNPKFISNITHRGDKKISFDFMDVQLRDYITDNITQVNYYSNLPNDIEDQTIYFVKYNEEDFSSGYYRWYEILQEWRLIVWDDYSYRSYPATPISPIPDNNQTLSESNILSFLWEDIKGADGYWLQVSQDSAFTKIILDVNNLTANNYDTQIIEEAINYLQVNEKDLLINDKKLYITYYPHKIKFSNNKYYWRIKVRNKATFPNLPLDNPLNKEEAIWSAWSNNWQFTLNTKPFPYNKEIIKEETIFVKKEEIASISRAIFNIRWDNISGAEKYQIQILENKPYIWYRLDDFNLSYNNISSLPNNLSIGTKAYVIDEGIFYKYTSIEKDWVEIESSESYSVIDYYINLPKKEQNFGDVWLVLDENKFYQWQSINNQWLSVTDMYGVFGNVDTIDNLYNLNEGLYAIYYVIASGDFYQYTPAEDINQPPVTIYDAEVSTNSFNINLGNGKYYWRIKPFIRTKNEKWGRIYEFTIDF